MLKPRRISASHRDAFLERYQGLHAWAVQMTANDQALAEDLLHDLFILFTLNQPDLKRIENLDSYLYACLRNLHISQLRRATRSRFEQLSIVEYDSARYGLHSVAHGRDWIQVQDELRRVCHYACARKATANAASVLILRFFHGYYPSEIAKVIRATRPAVDKRILAARVEAKAYLENSDSLSFMYGLNGLPPEVFPAKFARTPGDFLLELQETIFRSRTGECLSEEDLDGLYEPTHQRTIPRRHLAHIVSCPACLDTVNRLLGLPLLAERYPTDTMDKDNKKGGGPADDGGKGGTVRKLAKWEREAREAFEHKPQELCVSVNGYLLGSQLIGSELSELTINVAAEERISFCEVFSEQGVRLMMMNVDELPPNGPGELRTRVNLSEARTLESALLFSNPFPTLHVTYHDPALAVEAASERGLDESGEIAAPVTLQQKRIKRLRLSSPIKKLDRPISSLARALRERFLNLQFWLKPATITAVVVLGLIAAVILLEPRQPAPPLTAVDLLQRSAQAEEAIVATPDTVVHRTLQLEERSSKGDLISRHRIESWQSGERGVVARRLYNENNALIAGDWRRADGVQTLYHHGAKPQLQLAPERRGATGLAVTFDNAWQLSLSAKEFNLLIANAPNAQVEELPNSYVISTDVSNASVGDGASLASSVVEKAAITLNRTDLRAIEQLLVVRQGNESREYRFIESSFETKPLNTVTPSVFDPEPELLSSTELEPRDAKSETEPAPDTRHPTPGVATAALEVEVIDLLNRAGAFTGEQIDVSRPSDGRLQVNALVETDKRKAELFAALASVKDNPAVRISIETVAEAQARESRKQKSDSQAQGAITVDQFTATENPVFNELRKHFSESEAQAFADRVVRRSIQARRHATALRQLSERFSATDLVSLSTADRARWLGLLRGHAAKFLAENGALQRELQTVFPDIGGGGGGRARDSDREIQAAIRELYGLAVACDEDLRASFASFTNAGASAEVKTAKFWRALNAASALARSVQTAR